MTTATAPAIAPETVEAAVREALRRAIDHPHDPPRPALREAIAGYIGVLDYSAHEALEAEIDFGPAGEDAVFVDLRRSEARTLVALCDAAAERALAACEAIIAEQLVDAAQAFVHAHPDATPGPVLTVQAEGIAR